MKFYNAEILGAERTQRIQNATKSDLANWLKLQLPGVKVKALPTEQGKSITQDVEDSPYKLVLDVIDDNDVVEENNTVAPLPVQIDNNDMTQPETLAQKKQPPATK